MNNETYTKEQHELIADLCTTYGIEPDQIVFFENDPEPIFDREATSVLLHKLTDVAGIEDDPLPPPSVDSVAAKYRVTFKDGTFAGSSGVANLGEMIRFGSKGGNRQITVEEARSLAIGRAARSALKNKGINLLKLHHQRKSGNVSPIEFSGPARSERENLLRQVHALGYETGYIFKDEQPDGSGGIQIVQNKEAWTRMLDSRYHVTGSDQLTDDGLKGLAAFLRSQLPNKEAA